MRQSAAALTSRHAPPPEEDRPRLESTDVAEVLELPGPFPLHHGGELPSVRVAYRLVGPPRAPVVVALGGISADRHVADAPEGPGWWACSVGAGRALDTTRFRVLGLDYLGGSGLSTGPGDDSTFPSVSTFDQARSLLAVLNHLGVTTVHALVGASYGGMVALAFAQAFPERVARLVVVSAADRAHPMATAWRSVQRRIVRFAASAGRAAEGLKLARALAMTTYRTAPEFKARFDGPPIDEEGVFAFPVEQYLFARGDAYAARYRPASFVCLSESIDLHRVEPEAIEADVTLVGVREDALVPIEDLRALATRLGPRCQLVELSSPFGHDAFLKETDALSAVFHRALETLAP